MRILIFIFTVLALVIPCQARTITVDDEGPADFNNIQAAIDDANDGDEVVVADGNYTGDGNRDIDFLGKAITVRSESGPENCIIDCNGSKSDPHRGFLFHSGEDANCVLDGFTVTNGYADNGGGIYCHHGSPKISHCVIVGNSASFGGGIHSQDSSVAIVDCTIKGNFAGGLGGGIYYRYSSSITIRCTISGNSADRGGGIFNYTSSITISDCILSDNSAIEGGAVYIDPRAIQTSITNCTISWNWAEDRGGAIRSWKSSPIISYCIISGNSAGEKGGGLYFCSKTTPSVSNCLITANSADYGGGIYCFFENSVKFNHCTISGNFAEYDGGAIFAGSSKPVISHSILWGNAAGNGPEITVKRVFSSITSRLKVSYSNVQGGEANAYVGEGCTLEWDNGNIVFDPYFVDPGYWADVNDPNTIVEPNDANAVWVDGHYHLLAASPCIDAGDPNYVPEPNQTDLDGKPRVLDGDGDGTAVVDIGAYEYESVPAIEAVVKILPRTLNLQSKGRWLTCSILLPEGYDPADIEPNSVLLEEEIPAERLVLEGETLMVKFSRSALQQILAELDTPAEAELLVTGQLTDGTIFEGTDTITVIDKAGKQN